MKRALYALFFTCLSLFISGCETDFLPQRREIDDLQLVQVIGIDKSDADKNIITIASQKLETSGDQEAPGSGRENGVIGKALVLSAEGDTIFDAVRNIQTHSDKTVFWGHTRYYLIGEAAAKDNIAKHIDFFSRDHELRIEANIFVVKGSTAKELMQEFNKTDYFIVDKLDSLIRSFNLLSFSEEMRVADLMRFIDIHHGSARVPCIQLAKRETESEKQAADIESNGFGIIKDLKLLGYIERNISRGVNLITNNVDSSIVVVKDLAGENASLEIIQSKTEIIPYFSGNKLTNVIIKTKVKSNLGEIRSQMETVKESSIHFMEQQQSEILKKEMEIVLEKVLEFESDCLDICNKIRLRTPVKWHKIEKEWMDILPRINFHIEVESTIERTYELKEPSGYKGRE